MPLEIVRNDITAMKVDAIVNAANAQLAEGGGVCGAIFHKAGAGRMRQALTSYGTIATGQAVITPGFALQAKYVIHAVGPIYHDGKQHEEELLTQAYENSLQLAIRHDLRSIAFPLLSAGIYGYPKEEALQVAVRTIKRFLDMHELMVYLVVFDKKSYQLSPALCQEVKSYLDKHSVGTRLEEAYDGDPHLTKISSQQSSPSQEEKDFRESLFEWLDKKKLTELEFCKAANLESEYFSKLHTLKHLQPSRSTAFASCIALKLTCDQTEDLLAKAGYAFSNARKFDLIIRYALEHRMYDIHAVNQLLFEFDQPLLGGMPPEE